MSTDGTCNSSFWTREEEKILENTAVIYDNKDKILDKMEEPLPVKSHDDVKDYHRLLEKVDAAVFGRVPVPNPEMQSDASQNSKADVERRKGTAWTDQEHSSFLRGLKKHGKGDWRSISRHYVITRTAKQVASHAQNFFKRHKTADKGITSVDAEAAGTSLVPNTENMIGPACGGSQAVPNSINESMLPQEITNAEQMIAVAGGIDDLTAEQKDANETAFLVDTAGRSLSPSKQPCTAASSLISRTGNDLEALLAEPKDDENDISSIFDVGNAPPSSYTIVFVPPSAPPSNTPVDDEALAYVDDLFIDPMF